MDAATRERLLATMDVALNHGAQSSIERVRLLDLWWRIATDGRRDGAMLEPADAEFLKHSLREAARRSAVVSAAFLMTIMALIQVGVVS
jgi:hypothetical protein